MQYTGGCSGVRQNRVWGSNGTCRLPKRIIELPDLTEEDKFVL